MSIIKIYATMFYGLSFDCIEHICVGFNPRGTSSCMTCMRDIILYDLL